MSGQRKRPRDDPQRISSQEFPGLQSHNQQAGPSTDLDFSIQGYEATLVYGQEAFAKKLRLPEEQGGNLIRWVGEECLAEVEESDRKEETELWIDRYGLYSFIFMQRRTVDYGDVLDSFFFARQYCQRCCDPASAWITLGSQIFGLMCLWEEG
jgi:hypothetical protein